ncbi:hypothetical protein BJV78DRAFT_28260 [Lactifluus subvellereus]|nr:hypothetical protein BJV78DRAFT_28260 [Lactifluus subvellereus]
MTEHHISQWASQKALLVILTPEELFDMPIEDGVPLAVCDAILNSVLNDRSSAAIYEALFVVSWTCK